MSKISRLIALAVSCFAGPAFAGTQSVIYDFTGKADGNLPFSLVADAQGNFYVDTLYGGLGGFGTIDRIDPNGIEKTLVSFTTATGVNLEGEGCELTLAGDFLFGTTPYSGPEPNSEGTLFSVKTDGSDFRLIHDFTTTDGGPYRPIGTLVPAPGGTLYGVAANGGANQMGALYQIGRNGAFAVLYNFSLGFPSPIVADQAGNVFGSLYVPTSTVRSSTAPTAYVYEFVPSTGAFTVLTSFDQSQGAPLITSVDRNDNLYGTTTPYLRNRGNQLIELTPGQNGDATVILHQFSPTSLGTATYSQQQPNGFTLGANRLGTSNNGDLFVYNAGQIDIFYQFLNPASGEQPSAAPLSMGDGSLVGITAYGGLTKNCNGFDSCGVLYRYTRH